MNHFANSLNLNLLSLESLLNINNSNTNTGAQLVSQLNAQLNAQLLQESLQTCLTNELLNQALSNYIYSNFSNNIQQNLQVGLINNILFPCTSNSIDANHVKTPYSIEEYLKLLNSSVTDKKPPSYFQGQNLNNFNNGFTNNESKAVLEKRSSQERLASSHGENVMLGRIRERSIKNNKLVYVHARLSHPVKKKLNSIKININLNATAVSSDVSVKKIEGNEHLDDNEEESHKAKKSRGSKYRGVSRNGNQWQVLIMVNKRKRYVGSFDTEEMASKTYDKVCIQNHGARAKTNHFYSEEEIKEILNAPKVLKLEHE